MVVSWDFMVDIWIYPPINVYIASENSPFIMDLPIKMMIFHDKLLVYQRVCHMNGITWIYPLVSSNMACWKMDHRNRWFSERSKPPFSDRGFSSKPWPWWNLMVSSVSEARRACERLPSLGDPRIMRHRWHRFVWEKGPSSWSPNENLSFHTHRNVHKCTSMYKRPKTQRLDKTPLTSTPNPPWQRLGIMEDTPNGNVATLPSLVAFQNDGNDQVHHLGVLGRSSSKEPTNQGTSKMLPL